MTGNSTAIPGPLGSAFHLLFGPYFFVWFLMAAAIIAGVVFLRMKGHAKKEVSVEMSENSKLPTAEQFMAKAKELEEEIPPQPVEDGHSIDIEERLIQAVANAPWTISEDSEMALVKNGGRWKIEADRIKFKIPKTVEPQPVNLSFKVPPATEPEPKPLEEE